MTEIEFAIWLIVAFCIGCVAAESWARREYERRLRQVFRAGVACGRRGVVHPSMLTDYEQHVADALRRVGEK